MPRTRLLIATRSSTISQPRSEPYAVAGAVLQLFGLSQFSSQQAEKSFSLFITSSPQRGAVVSVSSTSIFPSSPAEKDLLAEMLTKLSISPSAFQLPHAHHTNKKSCARPGWDGLTGKLAGKPFLFPGRLGVLWALLCVGATDSRISTSHLV